MTGATASMRDRRRAATVEEIKQAAIGLLTTGGTEALALRAVAREVGMTVQSLYHYFDNREALITDLVTDGFDKISAAVAGAYADHGAEPYPERLVNVCLAYRRWATTNRPLFLLIFGTPIIGYDAPPDGPTTAAAAGLGQAFLGPVYGGWTERELAAVPGPPAGRAVTDQLTHAAGKMSKLAADSDEALLPAAAFGAFVGAWAQLHGMVMLEVLGHLPWLEADIAEDYYRVVLGQLAERFERFRSGAVPADTPTAGP